MGANPFLTALSGLSSSKTAIAITSNNIANTETPGFKSSFARYGDIFSGASKAGGFKMETGASTVGSGVNVQKIDQKFLQGNIAKTGNELDLAINGQGFFQVKDTDGTVLYTRVGALSVSRDGDVMTATGQKLMAFTADINGKITSFIDELKFSRDSALPSATTEVTISANLDAAAEVPPQVMLNGNGAFDKNNPDTYNFATSATLYDSLGIPHLTSVYFSKDQTDPSVWHQRMYMGDVLIQVDPQDGTGALQDSSEFKFDTNGKLITINNNTNNQSIYIVPGADSGAAGGPDMLGTGAGDINPLTFNFGSVTQYGNPFNINEINQNGFSTGSMAGIEITDTGMIGIRFNNGESRVLGQLALANFNNPNGLKQLGDGLFMETSASGSPITGIAANGDFGSIKSGGLEGSNVELAEELVALITAQRSYQANAQVISTWDELLQEAIQLGR
jgi:flagellar hook protein FlgE